MKFGITAASPCNYLPEQQEQLLIYVSDKKVKIQDYDLLIHAGFRRSGTQVYRPHCAQCQACESIRIPVSKFSPSKSQKRTLKRNQDVTVRISQTNQDSYYPLYESYINQRHDDGSMYPASREQYNGFILNPWHQALFIEMYLVDELIGVAVTDNLPSSLSALYTFFKPSEAKRSLGHFAILQQIALCQKLNKPYLYLGYQIDACQKMAYKQNFLPHERFLDNKWQLITKKSG
ncbi:arginyltransferase [Paraglaciecola aestuariivivens]